MRKHVPNPTATGRRASRAHTRRLFVLLALMAVVALAALFPDAQLHALNAAGRVQRHPDQRSAELRRQAQGQPRLARRHGDGADHRGRRDHVHGRPQPRARHRDPDDRGPRDPRLDQRHRRLGKPAVVPARVPRPPLASQHHRSDRQRVLRRARHRARPRLAQARHRRARSSISSRCPTRARWRHVGRLQGDMTYLARDAPARSRSPSERSATGSLGLTGAAHPVDRRHTLRLGDRACSSPTAGSSSQTVAATNTLTHAILGFPTVADGLQRIIGVLFGGALLERGGRRVRRVPGDRRRAVRRRAVRSAGDAHRRARAADRRRARR